MKYESDLWKNILNSYSFELTSFRRPNSINSRFAHWNPTESSLRWFKSFLNLVARQLSFEEISMLQKIGSINIGDPITIKIDSEKGVPFELNLDYIISVNEMEFLKKNLKIENIESILEIGAGFGRTAHAILRIFPSVKTYFIVDLPEVLEISKKYLKEVLLDFEYEKLTFISTEEVEKLDKKIDSDLSIQSDGLQEMDESVIDFYYKFIISKSRYFFSNNPICKYLPEHAGLDSNSTITNHVFSLGKSKQIANIWDLSGLDKIRLDHIAEYRPEFMKLIHSEPSKIFPHYQLSLYAYH